MDLDFQLLSTYAVDEILHDKLSIEEHAYIHLLSASP
jgi:hypothetical protein